MIEKIGLLGAGGQADEAKSFLKGTEVEFYALNEKYIEKEKKNQINIVNPEEYQRMLPVVAAIGAPAIRKEMVEQWPGERFATIVAEGAYVDESSIIGEGSIIAPRATITTNVEVGRHSIINVGASVSHDCKLGEYVTIGPGAHIAGKVKLGEGVFVGIGAIISNNVELASGVVVGAGAVVIHNVEQPNSVIVGTPARVIRTNDGWLREV